MKPLNATISKNHWSERAHEGLRDTARFLSDHGLGFALSNYGLWGAMTATTAFMAASAENPLITEQLHAMAISLGATGILVSGGIGVATTIANQMLNKLDFRDQRDAVQRYDHIVETIQSKPDDQTTVQALGTLNDFIRQSPAARHHLVETIGTQQAKELDALTINEASTKSDTDAGYTMTGPSVS